MLLAILQKYKLVSGTKLHTPVLTSTNSKNNVNGFNASSAMTKNTCVTSKTAFPEAQSIAITTTPRRGSIPHRPDTMARSSTKKSSTTRNPLRLIGSRRKGASVIKPMLNNLDGKNSRSGRKSRSGRARTRPTRARRGTKKVWKERRASLRIIISIGSDFC